jgi:hypothetical protein
MYEQLLSICCGAKQFSWKYVYLILSNDSTVVIDEVL